MFFKKVKSIDTIVGIKSVDIIDVRSANELKMLGKIKGSRNIEMSTLISNPDKYLKKDKAYYIMCQSGMRSKRVVKQLDKLGYDVTNVKGGYGRQAHMVD